MLYPAKVQRESGLYVAKVQRASDGFVASYDCDGHLKRFLQSTANSHQTIKIGCAFQHR